MKRFFTIILCFGITTSSLGQNIQNYKYIRVPVKFDFLKEENQYQLNALTAFLFEKKGFEVLYRENIPKGIDPCDVLQANVHSDSGLFRSRLYFSLQNCENQTVFTSETGVSREKEFKVAYHEALRKSFTSFEKSLLSSRNARAEFEVSDVMLASKEKDSSKKIEEIIVDPVVTAEEIDSVEKPARKTSLGKVAFSEKVFTNGPFKYKLKNTSAGFDLYKEGSDEKFARLLQSTGGDNYLYSSGNISGNAFFDTSGNLVVEYLDSGSQQLVTVIYKLLAQ